MRRSLLAAAATAALLTAASPAHAVSKGVRVVDTLPDTRQATAINFITYGTGHRQREVMYAVGRFGLKSYDLSDPAHPELLDHLSSEDLKLSGDTEGTFWQNEDMDVDEGRKLVFLARDPRAYNGSTRDPDDVAGVYIVNAADPENLFIQVFEQLPTGHTTTCVEGCRYLWTGGPASSTAQDDGWPGGRPIFVTDITDPSNPRTFPDPVDTARNDGVTAYAHDVQVDAAGIAWVSGLGGTRGYWTSGEHYDPVQGVRRTATAWDPIPYGGGEFEHEAAPTEFMHNSFRPVGRTLRDGPRPSSGHRPGDLILATEEAGGTPTCETVARLVIGSLAGSYDGEAWRSTEEDPFRLQTVSTWSPTDQEGTDPNAAFCSAHYFDWRDRVLAYSWYDQGTRFVDVSDPENPVQVAYHRPAGGVSWAPYFHGDHVYVADHGLGVQVLELQRSTRARASARRPRSVEAPRIGRRHKRKVARLMRNYRPDPQLGWLCPIPKAT